MSDFETHPRGTAKYIAELEANIMRWNETACNTMRIIELILPVLPDSDTQLCGEMLGDMLSETPSESYIIYQEELTTEEKKKLMDMVDSEIKFFISK